jgi:hypothetical protein
MKKLIFILVTFLCFNSIYAQKLELRILSLKIENDTAYIEFQLSNKSPECLLIKGLDMASTSLSDFQGRMRIVIEEKNNEHLKVQDGSRENEIKNTGENECRNFVYTNIGGKVFEKLFLTLNNGESINGSLKFCFCKFIDYNGSLSSSSYSSDRAYKIPKGKVSIQLIYSEISPISQDRYYSRLRKKHPELNKSKPYRGEIESNKVYFHYKIPKNKG